MTARRPGWCFRRMTDVGEVEGGWAGSDRCLPLFLDLRVCMYRKTLRVCLSLWREFPVGVEGVWQYGPLPQQTKKLCPQAASAFGAGEGSVVVIDVCLSGCARWRFFRPVITEEDEHRDVRGRVHVTPV